MGGVRTEGEIGREHATIVREIDRLNRVLGFSPKGGRDGAAIERLIDKARARATELEAELAAAAPEPEPKPSPRAPKPKPASPASRARAPRPPS